MITTAIKSSLLLFIFLSSHLGSVCLCARASVFHIKFIHFTFLLIKNKKKIKKSPLLICIKSVLIVAADVFVVIICCRIIILIFPYKIITHSIERTYLSTHVRYMCSKRQPKMKQRMKISF